MPTDYSQTTRIKMMADRTLAVYALQNPGTPEFRSPSGDGSAQGVTDRAIGFQNYTEQSPGSYVRNDFPACCATPVTVCALPGDFVVTYDFITSGNTPGDIDVFYAWTPSAGATSYGFTSDQSDGIITQTSPTTATLNTNWVTSPNNIVFTVTAINACGSNIVINSDAFPCFLAGSLVTLADSSTKPIEDIIVGDLVIGAFGEINMVLALHRPLLGFAQMCKINETHSTTNHHPHISKDKKFYCGDPARVSNNTYGRTHEVINALGEVEEMMLYGLAPERINKLTTGVELKTIEGSRVVNTLEVYSMPPETQLYNLVVGGSHTYHVDGYAVTGWPREDDFNYDLWQAR